MSQSQGESQGDRAWETESDGQPGRKTEQVTGGKSKEDRTRGRSRGQSLGNRVKDTESEEETGGQNLVDKAKEIKPGNDDRA